MRLKERYTKEIIPKLKEKLNIKNTLAVPKVNKVIVSVGVGEAKENAKIMEMVEKDLVQITGQKSTATKAKKAISGFKIRAGEKIGLKVTLRGNKMYDYLERLINIALPRIRDFRGLKDSGFDGCGNYNLGLKEHIVFPEVKYDKVEKNFGFQTTINCNTSSNKHAKELLLALGFPFEKKTDNDNTPGNSEMKTSEEK